jgi:hypothetical protein
MNDHHAVLQVVFAFLAVRRSASIAVPSFLTSLSLFHSLSRLSTRFLSTYVSGAILACRVIKHFYQPRRTLMSQSQ